MGIKSSTTSTFKLIIELSKLLQFQVKTLADNMNLTQRIFEHIPTNISLSLSHCKGEKHFSNLSNMFFELLNSLLFFFLGRGGTKNVL